MDKKTKKRLVVDVLPEQHEIIKMYAHKSYVTMNVYILRAIAEKVIKDHGEKEMLKMIKVK